MESPIMSLALLLFFALPIPDLQDSGSPVSGPVGLSDVRAQDPAPTKVLQTSAKTAPVRLDWTTLPFPQMEPGARLGQAMALGDFDGDGWQDLAVSAPGAIRPGGLGEILVAMAAPGGLREGVREILRVAPPAHQPEFEALEFGAALCICELDDDSAAELLIGAPLSGNGSGTVFVWGIDSLQKPAHMLLGADTLPGRLGHSVAAGDFDGDGRWDLAMGAPLAHHGEHPGGAVLVLSTKAGRRVLAAPRPASGAGFGSALAILDLAPGAAVNLVVSAPDADGEGVEGAGQVWIYSAGLRPIQPTLLTDPDLDLPGPSSFGRSISALGKTLLVGAPDRSPSRAGVLGGAFRYRQELGRPVRLLVQGAEPRPSDPAPSHRARHARLGLRVLAANMLGGAEPDALVATEAFFGVEGLEQALLIWPGADPEAKPIALNPPPEAGLRWMQSLAVDSLNSDRACLLAGDPSFGDPSFGVGVTATGSNRGRVMLGVLVPR